MSTLRATVVEAPASADVDLVSAFEGLDEARAMTVSEAARELVRDHGYTWEDAVEALDDAIAEGLLILNERAEIHFTSPRD